MKIGICQINTTVGDFSGNCRRIEEGARKAHQRGAQLAAMVDGGRVYRDPVEKRNQRSGATVQLAVKRAIPGSDGQGTV